MPTILVIRDDTEAMLVEKAVGKRWMRRFHTPHDRVVKSIEEALEEMRDISSALDDPGKSASNLAIDHLADELDIVAQSFGGAALRLATIGTLARSLKPALEHLPNVATVQVLGIHDDDMASGHDDRQSCHGVIVSFGASINAIERDSDLRRAMEVLPPGGALIVLADVVSIGDSQAPAIDSVLDEIQRATGAAIALEELRSVRWPEDPMCRSVLLRYSALTMALEARESQ